MCRRLKKRFLPKASKPAAFLLNENYAGRNANKPKDQNVGEEKALAVAAAGKSVRQLVAAGSEI